MTAMIDRLKRSARLPGLLQHIVCAAFLASGLASSVVHAGQISNTAYVFQYADGAYDQNDPATYNANDPAAQAGWTSRISSNTLQLRTCPLSPVSSVTLYQYAPDSAGLAYAADQYRQYRFDGSAYDSSGSGSWTPAMAPLAWDATAKAYQIALDLSQPLAVRKSRVFHADEPVFITLADGSRNLLPDVRDTVVLTITSSTGDRENLRLTETEVDSGIFSAVIQTVDAGQATVQFNGRISVGVNESLTVNYNDSDCSNNNSSASALVDPFGVLFDSLTGTPVDGATVRIINTDTNTDAQVFGDDGVSPYPSTVISGQDFTNPGDGVFYDVPGGGYRFPFVQPGNYRFEITPPANYLVPSGVAPGALPNSPGGQPYSIVAGSYLDPFVVLPGPALNIDVPMDPLSSSLALQKAVTKSEAGAGDFLQYRLTLRNADTVAPAVAPSVVDVLPFGMVFQRGSLRIDGVAAADPVIAGDGRTMTITLADLAPNTSTQVTYVVTLVAAIPPGNATNTAQASANAGGIVSNQAQVTVRVREPLISGRFTIIGRVYEGDCNTPWEKLRGVANVRILMEDGTYAITDADGQYHFEGVRPGTHVVQMDVDSLPGSHVPSSCIENTRFAGQNHSQFVDVKGGGLWRADFHTRRRVDNVGMRMTSRMDVEETVYTPPPKKKIRPVVFAPREVKNYTLKAEFDSCRDTLKPEGEADVQALIMDLREEKIDYIELIGNTDSQKLSVRCQKMFADNYVLSEARAQTVGNALATALALKPEQIKAIGKGADNPVADNATPAGMARNRRTELRVHLKPEEVAAPVQIGEDEYEPQPEPIRTVTLKGMSHRIEVDGTVPVKDLRVMAMLPEGYNYEAVSTRINGLAGDGPAVNDGILMFRLGDVDTENWQRVIEFNVAAQKVEAPKPKVIDKSFTLNAQFDSCSTGLKADGERSVAKLIKDLRDIQIERLELVGHTDDQKLSPRCQKIYADNYVLSQARARAIGDVIAKALSLKPEQIVARGMGPDVPVAGNATAEGKAANRRTEVNVQGSMVEVLKAVDLRPACETQPYVIKSVASFESLLKKRQKTPTAENKLACGAEAAALLQPAAPVPAAPAPATPVAPDASAVPATDATTNVAATTETTTETTIATVGTTAAADNSAAGSAAPASGNAGEHAVSEPAPVAAVDPYNADSGRAGVSVEGGLVKLPPADVQARMKARESILSDAAAAGAETDFLEGQKPGKAWLFPKAGYNPRSPSVRIVIKHGPGDIVTLKTASGDPVSALNFDGTLKSADEKVVLSRWRGVTLKDGKNDFVVEITDAKSGEVTRFEQSVVYANSPMRAELVPQQSVLLADGINKPVIAVRLLDRDGNPVRKGVTGPVQISQPYIAAEQIEQQQHRQLAGLDNFQPQYRVEGDEGIAYIELAPTTESGAVVLDLNFQVGPGMMRAQQLRTWVQPAPRDWVVVGFAEGTFGYNTLRKNIQPLVAEGVEDGAYSDGQISLYAKGRVKGEWLMTMAFDSDKSDQKDRLQSVLGAIDPNEYYTLYGDGSEQRYDAPSQDKLYLKLERGQFYALFGDYDSGLTQTQLTRYSRTLNGLKAEQGAGRVTYVVFAAETPQNSVRDDIQGNGTSGLYRFSRGGMVLNTERIRIETRDRLHSHKIVDSRVLTRHLDYDIDYAGGTVFFRQPVPSRDANFNPVFIVAEYETLGVASKELNAGGRVAMAVDKAGTTTVGVTAVRDENSLGASTLNGIDATVKLAADTELRIEAAVSDGQQALVSREGSAWLFEAEHHTGKLDGLFYARRQEAGFGLTQQNSSESGQMKTGVEGRVRLDGNWSVEGQAFNQENLATAAERNALGGKLRYSTERGGYALGAQMVSDEAGGQSARSEQATLAANRWFNDRKLELSAQADSAFGGNNDSVDYPNRLMLGANYALTDDVRLLAGQEFTEGGEFDTSTTRVGLQTLPWKGARLETTLNQSQMSEYGPRTFAQYGLTQAVLVNDRWGFDASLDASNTLNESATAPIVLNPAHPVAPGGTLSAAGATEDYYAVSLGTTYRAPTWSWNGRGETRMGELTDKYGVVSNFLRQARAGVAFASSAQLFKTQQSSGTDGLLASVDLSWAWRPLGVRWSLLDRLELRYEEVGNGSGVVGGGVISNTSLNALGNAKSRRIINNLAINRVSREWTGEDREGNLFNRYERSQMSFFYGAKYVMDTFDGVDYAGYTDVIGAEFRYDLTNRIDVGVQASSLNSWESHTHKYSVGPMVGFSPVKNGWITVGYNVRGFYDRDFDAARYTGEGPYLQLRLKFDQNTRVENLLDRHADAGGKGVEAMR